MRNLNSKLVVNFISEQGFDPIEKTYVAYTPLENYICIAVAESYDNETDENSAQLAVESVLTAFEKKPSLKRIPEYIRYANEQISLHSTKTQLKVSLTVLVSDYTRMRYGICGNTRIYMIYENLFIHISKTQTTYHQILDGDREMNPDSSQIHNLTEYLGRDVRIKPFISKIMEMTEGSTLLFATSNLWGQLSEVEILDAYEFTNTGREFLDILQELLLSYQDENDQRIGSFTAAILYVEKTFKEDIQKKKKKKKILIFLTIFIASILIISLVIILCMRTFDRGKMKEIEKHSQRGIRYMDYQNYAKALEEYELAAELASRLNLSNGQYIEKKRELAESITDREAILNLIQQAQSALSGNDYELANSLYTQIQKEATYQGFDSLVSDAGKKLDEILLHMQVLQYISLGDMYGSTEDYEEALEQYSQALEYLSKTMDLQTQGDVQAKIYAIRQKQKEESQAAAAAEQEEALQKQEEEAAEKKAEADRTVIKVNTLIANANNALDEGRTARAKELYRQALSRYNKFTGASEDADKLYKDITSLGQAITEAEVKAGEEALEERISQASRYTLQAKEATKNGDTEEALEFYEEALAVYKELNIWDERTEAIYDAISGLGNPQGQGNATG